MPENEPAGGRTVAEMAQPASGTHPDVLRANVSSVPSSRAAPVAQRVVDTSVTAYIVRTCNLTGANKGQIFFVLSRCAPFVVADPGLLVAD